MSRAIVGTESWGLMQERANEIARRFDAGEDAQEEDYHLNFATTQQLFGVLTPARLALLEALKSLGPVSIYALAKHVGRNYSNIHRDCGKLLELGLIEKDADGLVLVPWEEIQVRVTLGGRVATA